MADEQRSLYEELDFFAAAAAAEDQPRQQQQQQKRQVGGVESSSSSRRREKCPTLQALRTFQPPPPPPVWLTLRRLPFQPHELPTAEEVLGMFLAARMIAQKVKEREDYHLIRDNRKRPSFTTRSHKTMSYLLVNAYVQGAAMEELAQTAASITPCLSRSGFRRVSETLLGELAELLDLIVFEQQEFLWWFTRFFDSYWDNKP